MANRQLLRCMMTLLLIGRNCSSFSLFSLRRLSERIRIQPLIFRNDIEQKPKRSFGLFSLLNRHQQSIPSSTTKASVLFSSSSIHAEQENWKNQGSQSYIANMLVCGDGDLSFSAAIANSLSQCNVKLIATVLEDEPTHRDVYQRSATNENIIRSFPETNHEVKYGVDATRLKEVFPNTKFDRIRFNFPHWRGKANHRYNRQLIDAFLKSASMVLSENGEIHIALCEGQGGSSAKSLQEYRDTWTPLYYASMHGLMLIDVFPFSPVYNLSSHRGVDRGFKIGKAPEMYVFAKPNDQVQAKQREQMLCCRHELHVVLPENYDETNTQTQYSLKDFTDGNAIHEIIKKITPDGIYVEVPERRILMKDETGYDFDMALFLVVYCGESKVLKRDQADGFRHDAECAIEQYIPLRENRRGRLVSRPFPYYLLQSIINDHTS